MEIHVSNNNKPNTINRNRQAIAGIQKHFATAPTIVLDGKPTKPADAIAILQTAIDATDGTTAADTALHTAVAAEKAAVAGANAVRKALKTLVFNAFGPAADAVTDFGFTKPKKATPTVAVKAGAVAKRAATRTARHTMGPKQEAKITGETQVPPVKTPPADKPA
ncbi:MAG TPA: hypothetical protein VIF15_00765 [Polyangiaceae bacterium]|jgi:hypothetical protein